MATLLMGSSVHLRGQENTWRSDHCNRVVHKVMCSKEMLVLVKENKTWEDALMHCRGLEAKDPRKPFTAYENYKYDLATLLTEDDHKFARETAKSATTDKVWTGLRYLAGYWLWVGGEERMYKDIDRCPSRGFCGTLPTTGNDSYEIRPCNEKRNFFCYRMT
ncbi:dromaiocalcin-1-like isoform X2 [Notolabrus celidotus]|uniref:dromaiocalcin-1-like isoform X2 n=1 Tax=Notolabrus celidotus TaxID=1203425 RepID=UPI00148F48CA|nr:dromaiocalcin-1-like isoform X2 [Notolabrus celidotus]